MYTIYSNVIVILLNKLEWSSSCSCAWWHKNNKCNHTISLFVGVDFVTDPSVKNSVMAELTVVKPEDNPPIKNKRRRRKKS